MAVFNTEILVEKVTNDISGYGRWYTAGQRFIGGSSRGDIGTNRCD